MTLKIIIYNADCSKIVHLTGERESF